MKKKPCKYLTKAVSKAPRCNDVECYDRYFTAYPSRYLILRQEIERGNRAKLIDVFGKKLIKQYERFENERNS
jgi:hypothetical protein